MTVEPPVMVEGINTPSLRHRVEPTDPQHEMFGFRAFSMWHQLKNPEENWGMDFGNVPIPPPWVEKIHNTHQGQRAFIFGTGPSLVAQLPLLGRLKQTYTFTCNRMKLWGDLPFTPFIHCVTEPGPMIDFGRRIHPSYDFPTAQNKIACIWWPVTARGWLWAPKAPDDLQVRWVGTFGMGETLPPIPTAWASPLTITQLALWMGFTEVVLLGVDTTQQGQAWDTVEGRTAKPRNIRSIKECADRMYRDMKRNGRSLLDATPGGRLNVEGCIPYVDLQEVLP